MQTKQVYSSPDFLSGGGEMGALMRSYDWSMYSLGEPRTWPIPLQTMVRLLLNTHHPMYIWWGSDLACLYNDAYRQSIGDEQHPSSLGQPARKVWDEIWDIIGPQIELVMTGQGATWNEDQLVPITRNGRREDVYWTYSYNPIEDASAPDGVGGVLVICTETTQAVLAALELRESEARVRAVTDYLPGAIVYQLATDPEGKGRRFLFVSARHEAFTGVPAEALLADPSVAYALIHEDDRELLAKAEAQSIANKSTLDVEVRFRRTDGEVRWCRIISAPRAQADGSMIWDGIQIETTEQKGVLEALRASDARFRFLERLADATQPQDDPETVMAISTKLLGEYLAADICAYADVETDCDTFHIRRDWTREDIPSIVGSYSLDDFGPVAAAAQRSGTTLVVSDAISELGDEQAFTGIGIAATICLPLVKNGRLAAMMAVHSAKPRKWSDEEVSIVREVAERCWAHVERVGANAVLRENEQRFREQFENANDFIFTTDLEMVITSCNPSVAAALEMKPEHLIGHRISEFTPQETWEQNKAMLASKLAGKGDSNRYEVEVFDRQGSRMMWEINSRLIRDSVGAPTGLHAIGRDVSERIRNQRLLDEARVRAEADAAEQAAILGQLAEGVIIADGSGRLTFVNDAATKLHGVAALDIEPSQYAETYHLLREDGSPYPFEELPLARAVLHGETVRDARWRIRRPDGSEVIAIGNARPVVGSEGEQIGAVLTVRDDTERNAAELALRDMNETLEERVAKRNAELEQAHEALRQSQKLEAMGQLTGGVAHDFNNLLTPILGSLDLLHRKAVGDERQQRLIDGALQSAERARLLVQRLLAFARRQPLQTVAVDIGELITGMAGLVASTCGPGIKVSASIEEDLSPALADPNQLEMAILNLSVNARDAMPDGGLLTLAATQETIAKGSHDRLGEGQYIRLSVADSGTGMDAETARRAIEPFFSTKGVGQGTGLGLSMAHGLASQLGGALTISSVPGLGTNVEIWIPASEMPIIRDDDTDFIPTVDVTAGRVLLVDDEQLVRLSTSDMLSELGYEVVEASSASEALEIFSRGKPFDMVVTDHLMPGMTGAQLAQKLSQLQPQLPVLIASGYADAGGIPEHFPRLTKPFRQADLLAAINEATSAECVK